MANPDQILEQLSDQAAPSDAELELLPRWALVAVAARAARRVQPLFTSDWRGAPAEYVETIDRLLDLAETSAASGETHPDLPKAIREAGDAAVHAGAMTCRFASFTVTFASIHAARVAVADGPDAAIQLLRATLDSCHKAATFASARIPALGHQAPGEVSGAISRAVRADVELLGRRAENAAWDDGTPVIGTALGDLWPDGAPRGLTGT